MLSLRSLLTGVATLALGTAVLPLNGCATDPNAVDNRDHAIDTYSPFGNQTAVAEVHAREWWRSHQQRFGNQPPLLAVQASRVFEGEIVQNLSAKLQNSQTTSLFYAKSLEQYPTFDLYSVLIFDTRTERLVSPQGFVVVDTPHRGTVARFGPYIARYIGEGR